MTTVYVYVMNTMADWEIGYCLAELAATLEHWYAYFSTGNANEFFAMMQILYGDMQAVRSGGDLILLGGIDANVKDYVCPDGCVCFRMTVEKTGAENFYKGKYYQE